MSSSKPATSDHPSPGARPVVETVKALEMSDLEMQVIELFVRGVRVLGLPKSVGEIYGLLYISPQPLSLDALVGRLRMSKGSTSQGLKIFAQPWGGKAGLRSGGSA